jgi:3-methyl-2-oxobutanoate hydroxymethyltransferase
MTERKPVTLRRLREMRDGGEKIAMLTCYDASFARAMDAAQVDVILVGDSLGMVLQGNSGTQAVSLDHMAYHVECVARARPGAWVIGDLPFGSYHASLSSAMDSASRLIAAGAQMVKLEGGGWTAETVHYLTERGVPVCAHLGLTPQSVHALGGWRVQGRTDQEAQELCAHARDLAQAGAGMLVLELVPAALASHITGELEIPVIGIGAGAGCSGQVLVLHDMLGLAQGIRPRFVRDFLADGGSIVQALRSYVQAVKSGEFPDDRVHSH